MYLLKIVIGMICFAIIAQVVSYD